MFSRKLYALGFGGWQMGVVVQSLPDAPFADPQRSDGMSTKDDSNVHNMDLSTSAKQLERTYAATMYHAILI